MAPLLIFCLLFCCFNSTSLSYSFLASNLVLMSLLYQLHKAKAYGFCVVGFCDLEGCSVLELHSHHRHWPHGWAVHLPPWRNPIGTLLAADLAL